MTRPKPEPSDAEWIVLHALWRTHPATARELLDTVGKETGWAYTTLKTMLTRMEEKGFVRGTSQGRSATYEPLVKRADTQRRTLKTLLDRVFEGATGSLVNHLIEHEKLSAADREKLQRWLDEVNRKEKSEGRDVG